MVKRRKIPENFFWFEVRSPKIPNGCYTVAALYEGQATAMVSKMFKTAIYLNDKKTVVTKIRKVEKSDNIDIENYENYKSGTMEGKVCPNQYCGYIDEAIGSDTCPGCGSGYYPETYTHVWGEL